MDLNLKDKVFVVTGGGKGIGEAITKGAAAEGATVIIVSRTDIEGTPLENWLKAHNAVYGFIKAELSDEDQCKKAIEEILMRYGDIYCLVNNAGVNDGVGLQQGTVEKFINSLFTNLIHYYALSHYAVESLKRTKGNIINISSKTAVTGQGNTSGYAASKGAQLALTREWAVEMLPYEVRVNCVIPAEVYTPLYDSWIKTFPNPEEKLKSITDKIPLGKRMTTSEEIASMVLYLASEKASHITGQHLFVDGGYTHLDRAL